MSFILPIFLLALSVFAAVRMTTHHLLYATGFCFLASVVYAWWVIHSCTGDCGIRVDFLLLALVMFILLLALLWRGLVLYFKRSKDRGTWTK